MELAAPFDISKPAVTKHLKVLENAGLLRRQIIGRIHRCRLVPQPLSDAAEWITFYEHFWKKKFDALDAHLNATSKKKGRKMARSATFSAHATLTLRRIFNVSIARVFYFGPLFLTKSFKGSTLSSESGFSTA